MNIRAIVNLLVAILVLFVTMFASFVLVTSNKMGVGGVVLLMVGFFTGWLLLFEALEIDTNP